MTVGDLQVTLGHLGRLFDAAGMAHSKLEEFSRFADGLEKFRGLSLTAFAELLGRMTESGELPQKVPHGRGTAKKTSVDVPKVMAEAEQLYRQAPYGIHEDEVRALGERMAGLSKDDLGVVASALEFKPTSKESTKPKLIAALCTKIEKRAGASIRRGLLNRPAEPTAAP